MLNKLKALFDNTPNEQFEFAEYQRNIYEQFCRNEKVTFSRKVTAHVYCVMSIIAQTATVEKKDLKEKLKEYLIEFVNTYAAENPDLFKENPPS